MKDIVNYVNSTIAFEELKEQPDEVISSVADGEFKLIIFNNEVKTMLISVEEYAKLTSEYRTFKKDKSATEIAESPIQNEIKVGKLVKMTFKYVEEKNLLTEDMIKKLTDLEYSKENFGISYKLLKEFDENLNRQEQIKGSEGDRYSRYWNREYLFNGKKYLICSQWYDRNKDRFVKWINVNLKIDPFKVI